MAYIYVLQKKNAIICRQIAQMLCLQKIEFANFKLLQSPISKLLYKPKPDKKEVVYKKLIVGMPNYYTQAQSLKEWLFQKNIPLISNILLQNSKYATETTINKSIWCMCHILNRQYIVTSIVIPQHIKVVCMKEQ